MVQSVNSTSFSAFSNRYHPAQGPSSNTTDSIILLVCFTQTCFPLRLLQGRPVKKVKPALHSKLEVQSQKKVLSIHKLREDSRWLLATCFYPPSFLYHVKHEEHKICFNAILGASSTTFIHIHPQETQKSILY